MKNELGHLYTLEKKDTIKSGVMFAEAFKTDPIWGKIFENIEKKQREIFFQGPARYCLKYGEVYATSENLEGIMAILPDRYADMTMRRALKAGSILNTLKGGMKLVKLMGKLNVIFRPLEESRKKTMKDRNYLYLIIIGVMPEFQGQGIGKKLLTALNERADSLKLPIYLETATDKNIKMYEKLGYKVTEKVIHPIINLPQWGMIREPVE